VWAEVPKDASRGSALDCLQRGHKILLVRVPHGRRVLKNRSDHALIAVGLNVRGASFQIYRGLIEVLGLALGAPSEVLGVPDRFQCLAMQGIAGKYRGPLPYY
jgi:hypothetical protein